MKPVKTLYAEATIYYTAPNGTQRIHHRRGAFKTHARDTETARPAYAKKVYRETMPYVVEHMRRARFLVLDPCDPCDRWTLESSGDPDTARILKFCDEQNAAAGRAIPRASFLPPAR